MGVLRRNRWVLHTAQVSKFKILMKGFFTIFIGPALLLIAGLGIAHWAFPLPAALVALLPVLAVAILPAVMLPLFGYWCLVSRFWGRGAVSNAQVNGMVFSGNTANGTKGNAVLFNFLRSVFAALALFLLPAASFGQGYIEASTYLGGTSADTTGLISTYPIREEVRNNLPILLCLLAQYCVKNTR